ncbi:MAG: hypothetical protein GX129_04050 [Clostridiales bacterium]|jgi:hypothetical protein|nr:hypothetical protein [Clostridiales bacterium]
MTKGYDYSVNENNPNNPINNEILMEILKSTLEKEDWQYAEQLALKIRELIPDEDKLVTSKVLQLLFSIRKEERELSIKRIEEFKEIKNMHP